MGYGEIRRAIRKLEDQQRADHDKTYEHIEKLSEALSLETDFRRERDCNLAEMVEKIENQQAQDRKHCLEQIMLTDVVVDNLVRRIAQLENGPVDDTPDASEDDEFWKSAWVPHSPKQRKQREAQKRRQVLVDYINNEIPNEKCPTEIEDVADTAIRLLKAYRAALGEITTELCVPRKAINYSITNVYRIAWDALKGETR